MSNLTEYAKNISPSLYEQLKQAAETGRWPDGKQLSTHQKESSLQLIMAYQSLYNELPDHFSIAKGGEIYMQSKAQLKTKFTHEDEPEIHIINL
ncbi:DUF1315 family protein [Psychromonas sp. MME2]|uniref:YeaC family protein n=1 Tax=unclassified Psychromonas TaxID=2614957 RepID=UPI00339BE2B5